MNEATQTAETSINPYHESYLAPYAPERSKVIEFAGRLRSSLSYKSAKDLKDPELLALAQASLAHGLNPYMGEIWALPGMGLMIGRAGWVKKLGEMGEKQNFKWWPSYHLLQHSQYKEYAVPDDVQIAFICEIRRSDWLEVYTQTLKDLTEHAKLEYEMIIELLGKPPVLRGVGYIGKHEKFGGSTMPLSERAKKRAFSQACREIVYLPFETVVDGDVINGQAIDEPVAIEGEFQVMDDPPKSNGNGSGDHHPAPAAAPEKLDLSEIERPMDPEVLQEYVRTNGYPFFPGDGATDKQRKVLSGLLKGLYKGSATQEKDAKAYLEFVVGFDTTEKLSKKTASVLIELLKSEDVEEWRPSDVAREEAQRVLRVVYKDQGQLDMFEDNDKDSGDEDPPAGEPKSKLAKAFPRDEDGNPVDDGEAQPKKAAVSAQAVKTENKAPVKPKAKKVPAKAENKVEEKPAAPAQVNDEDATILSLKRSKPASWLVASEWLRKYFKGFDMTPGQLREAVLEKKGMKFEDKLDVLDGWPMAIELGQAAAK